jgi:hypothetical protein
VSSPESGVAPDLLTTDPQPVAPERPGDGECCQSGCDPCILDYYHQEMERYRAELKAWRARHPDAGTQRPA